LGSWPGSCRHRTGNQGEHEKTPAASQLEPLHFQSVPWPLLGQAKHSVALSCAGIVGFAVSVSFAHEAPGLMAVAHSGKTRDASVIVDLQDHAVDD
jgi:hypothetical protein